VSIMKTRFGSNPSTDIVMTEEAENFVFGIIAATLRSPLLVLSLTSLSRSPDVSCLGPLEISPLVSRGSTSFPKDYFVNYCIGACDILRFHALYSYNNGTVWDSIRFLCRFTTPTTSCFADCIVILVIRVRSVVIVSLIPSFNHFTLRAGWGVNKPAAQKSAGIYLL